MDTSSEINIFMKAFKSRFDVGEIIMRDKSILNGCEVKTDLGKSQDTMSSNK